jgi:hypothetical protein
MMTAPRHQGSATSARAKVSLKLFAFVIAAIISAGHVLLSSSSLERSLFHDTAELVLSTEYADIANEKQRQYDELNHLKKRIQSLETRLERRAKKTDLIKLEKSVSSLKNSTLA